MTAFHRSFNEVYQMKPDQLQLGFLKVLKGSLMYQEAQKYGICSTKKKNHMKCFLPDGLLYEDIVEAENAVESMVEVYYNSGQFQHTLEYLVPLVQKMHLLFMKILGAFYEEERLQ